MNQSSQNNIRQVSQEEVARANGLTQEELQRTQVLNLKDVEEVASFEKRTSKKPAIIVAVMGILSITFGGTFSFVQTLTSKPVDTTVEKRKVENVETLAEDKIETLNCVRTTLNNADGTDVVFNINYSFKNNGLASFTKTYNVTQTPGNPLGLQGIQNYVVGYQPYTIEQDGYKVNVTPAETAITAVVDVDLEKLNLTTFPEFQQTHESTKLDYYVGTEKDVVNADMTAKGFICQ